jgi:hypothetical protein
MLVDSGAYMMAINETIQAQLQLPYIEKRKTFWLMVVLKNMKCLGLVL